MSVPCFMGLVPWRSGTKWTCACLDTQKLNTKAAIHTRYDIIKVKTTWAKALARSIPRKGFHFPELEELKRRTWSKSQDTAAHGTCTGRKLLVRPFWNKPTTLPPGRKGIYNKSRWRDSPWKCEIAEFLPKLLPEFRFSTLLSQTLRVALSNNVYKWWKYFRLQENAEKNKTCLPP